MLCLSVTLFKCTHYHILYNSTCKGCNKLYYYYYYCTMGVDRAYVPRTQGIDDLHCS